MVGGFLCVVYILLGVKGNDDDDDDSKGGMLLATLNILEKKTFYFEDYGGSGRTHTPERCA